MNEFIQTALTFPTLIYSIVLTVCILYWLMASTGLVDMDGADHILVGDGDAGDWHSAAGILSRLGLGRVPIMIVLTLIAFFGWLVTYYFQLFFINLVPGSGVMRYVIGTGVAIAALIPGIVVTALILKPIRILLHKLRPEMPPSILGKTATVSTPTVGPDYGMAAMNDGGAGLNLQVRYAEQDIIKRGDPVVLLEYIPTQNAYRVIPEKEFQSF